MISFTLMLSASLLLAPNGSEQQAPLRVENGWVREAPPVARVLAAYVRLCNDSPAPVTLAGARSASFERVEMHTTIETDSATRMERLEFVVIDAHDCVDFAPGGNHFMLFEPQGALRAGDDVKFTLEFSSGEKMEIVFPVRRADDMNGQQHGHHHGH